MRNLRKGALMITLSQGHSSKDSGGDREFLHTHPFLGLPFQVAEIITRQTIRNYGDFLLRAILNLTRGAGHLRNQKASGPALSV